MFEAGMIFGGVVGVWLLWAKIKGDPDRGNAYAQSVGLNGALVHHRK